MRPQPNVTETNSGLIVPDTGSASIDDCYLISYIDNLQYTRFVAYGMRRYRNHLVNERIPWMENNENAGLAFAAFATDTKNGYKSTATLRAVSEYLERVDKVFGYRPSGSLPHTTA